MSTLRHGAMSMPDGLLVEPQRNMAKSMASSYNYNNLGWQCRQHVSDMSARQSNVGTWADTALSCRHKTDPVTAFSCCFFFKYQRQVQHMHNLPKITTHNNQHEPRRPTLHRLETSPSMGRPAAPPNHGAAASYRLARGERSQVMQSRCWFPCLGRQRKPYQ